MYGSHSVHNLLCRVMVCASCGVGESQCRGVAVWGSCSLGDFCEGESQSGGVAVCLSGGACEAQCSRVMECVSCDVGKL